MSDLKQAFLEGMSYAAATVNVVTTDGPAGIGGVTVSAMSSVSADTEKPSLLVCINTSSSCAEPILTNRVFCVNILRDDQSVISDRFAGRKGETALERFRDTAWTTGLTKAPLITGALVSFDCRLVNAIRVGTHHVLFGEVEEVRRADLGSALIYANRAYGTVHPLSAVRPTLAAAEATVRLACHHTFGPFFAPALLDAARTLEPGVSVELIECDQTEIVAQVLAGTADLGLGFNRAIPPTLEFAPLAQLRPYILLPAAHPLASKASVHLRDLIDTPLLLLDLPQSRALILSIFDQLGLTPVIRARFQSFEMIRSMVGHGHGFAILVTKPANSVTYDGMQVQARAIADPIDDAIIRVGLIHKTGMPSSPAVERLSSLCREVLFDPAFEEV